MRPISNVVDVTNYVMLEIGQPMHAFDLARLRRTGARDPPRQAGRAADDARRRRAHARCGDAGDRRRAARRRRSAASWAARDSEIGPGTTRIALESACFLPASVRRTSKRLGLKTEASIRFERGGDIDAPPAGIARAAALLQADRRRPTPVGGLDRSVSGAARRRPRHAAIRAHRPRARHGRAAGRRVADPDAARLRRGRRTDLDRGAWSGRRAQRSAST